MSESNFLPLDVISALSGEMQLYSVPIGVKHLRGLSIDEAVEVRRMQRLFGQDKKTTLERFPPSDPVMEWCDRFCRDYYSLTFQRGLFVSSDDAMKFKLAWG